LLDAHAAAATCRPTGSDGCSDLISRFNEMNKVLWWGYVLQAAPALIGTFVGAPVPARELETGTFRYAWTQGFGRWRWALAKLVTLAVVVAGALSLVFSWYYRPYLATGNDALSLLHWSPFAGALFNVRGVAFAAWTVAAFALGALAGARGVGPIGPAPQRAWPGCGGPPLAAGVKPHFGGRGPLPRVRRAW
jgi:hypothetical protein